MSPLLRRLSMFNEKVPITDTDLWAIVELYRFMVDVRRPPSEADVEACCRHVGADANKVLLYFYGRRPGRMWRWVGRKADGT